MQLHFELLQPSGQKIRIVTYTLSFNCIAGMLFTSGILLLYTAVIVPVITHDLFPRSLALVVYFSYFHSR